MDSETRQAIVDEEHLKMLSVGYYVSGAISLLYALFGMLYAGMGGFMFGMMRSAGPAARAANGPPSEVVWIFVAIGTFATLVFGGMAVAKFVAASHLRKRTGRMFCMVVAGLSCLDIPYGTCLGVFTFMILERPSVAHAFRVQASRT